MRSKTVLITGAAKRIGAAIAEHLHSAGMNVVIHYNTSAREARELVKKLNKARRDSAIPVQADLRYKQYYPALIAAATAFKGNIEVLVNNASAFFPTPLNELSDDQWDTLIKTNLKAPLFLSQSAAPSLRKTKGCIVNITDIHAYRPLKDYPVYSIAKAGLVMLTRALAKELAPVRVNAVSPGAIIWPDALDEATKHTILDQTALKKAGDTEAIAKAVMFLIKDADYITGQIINVDGGRTLYS